MEFKDEAIKSQRGLSAKSDRHPMQHELRLHPVLNFKIEYEFTHCTPTTENQGLHDSELQFPE